MGSTNLPIVLHDELSKEGLLVRREETLSTDVSALDFAHSVPSRSGEATPGLALTLLKVTWNLSRGPAPGKLNPACPLFY